MKKPKIRDEEKDELIASTKQNVLEKYARKTATKKTGATNNLTGSGNNFTDKGNF